MSAATATKKGYFATLIEQTPTAAFGATRLPNSKLAFGSVDKKADDGDGQWLVYNIENGKQCTKRRLDDHDTMVSAIKGEVWSENRDLPNPGFVPLNSVEKFSERRTIRPVAHNFAHEDCAYRDTFIAAAKEVLADPEFGPALAKMLKASKIKVK